MTEQAVIIGSHLRFIPDGTNLTGSVISSRTVKPEAADTAWLTFPVVEKAMLERSADEKEVWAPTPGARVLYDVIETKLQTTLKITLNQVSLLTAQMSFGMDAPDGTTSSFAPNSNTARKGWFELELYDHLNNPWGTVTVYGFYKLDGSTNFDDNITNIPITIRVLYSTLNLTEL